MNIDGGVSTVGCSHMSALFAIIAEIKRQKEARWEAHCGLPNRSKSNCEYATV